MGEKPHVPTLFDHHLKSLGGHHFSAFSFSLLNNHSNLSNPVILKGCEGQNNEFSEKEQQKKILTKQVQNQKLCSDLPGNVLNQKSKIMKKITKP